MSAAASADGTSRQRNELQDRRVAPHAVAKIGRLVDHDPQMRAKHGGHVVHRAAQHAALAEPAQVVTQ
jgi:hypothetical protein